MKRSAEKGLENTTKYQKIEGSSETDPCAGIDKEAALLTAASTGDIETVNNLIAHDVQVDAKNADGITALMFAIKGGHTNVAKALIKAGADKENSTQALNYALVCGQTEIAETLKLSAFIQALTKKIQVSKKDEERFNEYFEFLNRQPLGSWEEKLTNALLDYHKSRLRNHLLDFRYERDKFYLSLRILCEQYAKDPSYEKKELILKEIESVIIKLKEESFPKSGAKLPYETLIRGKLIKSVYLFEDEPLTKVFAKYLPVPSAAFFNGDTLPRYIANKEEQTNEIITHFLEKNQQEGFHSLEKKIHNIQRSYRATQRQKEEQHRIPERNPEDADNQTEIDTFSAPYMPQKCSPELAIRIFKAAGNVKFFNYIRHLTNKSALTNIFNDCFYGRKTLLMRLQEFSPASLHDCDVQDGDANVVCFGSDYGKIDPQANKGVELRFQLDKLNFGPKKSIHCAFFKQQDLGFGSKTIRHVNIGKEKELAFRHTGFTRCADSGYSYMHLRYGDRSEYNHSSFDTIARLPNFKLISYDINNIESVLILNFFRYLDNLVTYDYGDASDVISAIYHHIEEMNDEALAIFLEEIGRNLSDTMEFNFFGAHQIDFDALSTIKDTFSESHIEHIKLMKPDLLQDGKFKKLLTAKDTLGGYTLNMPELISELQSGKLEKLVAAKELFPTIFQSYRFLDYLSTKTDNINALLELSILRATCKTLGWYPKNEKFSSKTEHTLNRIETAAKHTSNIIENAMEKTSNIIKNATENTLNIIKNVAEHTSNAVETAANSNEVYSLIQHNYLQNKAKSLFNEAENTEGETVVAFAYPYKAR